MFGQNTNNLIKANGSINFKQQLKISSIQYCSRIDGFKWNWFFDYNFITIMYLVITKGLILVCLKFNSTLQFFNQIPLNNSQL